MLKIPDQKFYLDCSLENFVDICCELVLSVCFSQFARGIIVAAHAQLVATLSSLVPHQPACHPIGQHQWVGHWVGCNGIKQIDLQRQTNFRSALNLFLNNNLVVLKIRMRIHACMQLNLSTLPLIRWALCLNDMPLKAWLIFGWLHV